MISFGRTIDYARISVTDLCNLRCKYCMPEKGVEKQAHCNILSLEKLLTIEEALIESGINKIRITGGEPLVRKNVGFFIRETGKLPLKKLSLTTNGIYLPKFIDDITAAGITSINVSLDTLNEEKYRTITRGGELADVLKGIDCALSNGLSVKLNAVLLKGVNEKELDGFMEFCNKKGVFFRYIELMPFENEKAFYDEYSYSVKDFLTSNPKIISCNRKEGTSAIYSYRGKEFGIIAPLSFPFCGECNRIRITATGELLPCLHHNDRLNLAPYVDDKTLLKEKIAEGVSMKKQAHSLNTGEMQSGYMNKIGG